MRACSRRVFPQNTGPMRKTPDAQPDAQPDASSPPAGPAAAVPPRPPSGPPAGRRPTRQRAAAATRPPDRKRRRTANVDDIVRTVQAALALPVAPLMPTPQSLFAMLCGVFEHEFPGRLPQPAVEQAMQALSANA